MGNRTAIDTFITAIADIRGFVQPIAAFLYEILAGLITGRAGGTFSTTEKYLVAGIRLTTVITMDAKVVSIIECPFVIPVTQSM
jgi:membrane-associated PAP2 superfamily phosphatase